jgi:transcriptional regulator with XRE-family HTH domain
MRDVTNELLGQRVRAARQAAGLSQERFAHELGISQATVSRIEQGRDVTSMLLTRIARLTNKNLDYFLAPELTDMAVSFRAPDQASEETTGAVAKAMQLIQNYEFLLQLTDGAAATPRKPRR